MQVMMIFSEPPEDFAARTDPARQAEYWGAWTAYVGALNAAGITRGGNGLLPPETGVAVRRRDGATQVLDGPYAETREQLGGYFILEVPDVAAAIPWAERAPCAATGGVLLRPVLTMGPPAG